MQDALISLRDEREERMTGIFAGLYGDLNRLKFEDKHLSDHVSSPGIS